MNRPEAGRVLLVANLADEHLGAHLVRAAKSLGLLYTVADTREAWAGPALVRRLCHHLAGKRPSALRAFSARVLASCRAERPTILLSTGIAPIRAEVLRELRGLGVRAINFLTDDPWNPANGARYFWPALREYERVFSPRVRNLADLRAHGCREVRYLPFGYDPTLHFPPEPSSEAERARFTCDVAFIGAADADRIRLLGPLLASGLHTKLYGSFWARQRATRSVDGGVVLGRELRAAVAGAKVQVCIGRAANRDGHAMRSYELPAMGACMLVEDTSEHRDLFGEDGECVRYFQSSGQLVARARELCRDAAQRERLAASASRRITGSENTYADRLRALLQT